MKRLMGKTEVEDALQRLNMLTQEENLMTVARTLEATHHINVNVKTTQELTRTIDDNVKVTQGGAFIFQFLHSRTDSLK
jgi:hypothetical protein